jgi:alanine racemase
MSRPIKLRLFADALRSNLLVAQKMAPNSKVMAVVKANAYGHGVDFIAESWIENEPEAYAVISVDEARELRRHGVKSPIVLLEGLFRSESPAALIELNLQPVIHELGQLSQLLTMPDLVRELEFVWLKVDTGMHRLGLEPHELQRVSQQLRAAGVKSIGLMTHLSSADDIDNPVTQKQLAITARLAESDGWAALSISNSSGLVGWSAAHANWVRPGILLFGESPFPAADSRRSAEKLGLNAVMQFESEIISIRRIGSGEPVGYGGTWRAPRPMSVGHVAAGYGDGYPRNAPTGTPIRVDGIETITLGRVSMDSIAVDLSPIPDPKIGSTVELWGQNLPVARVAEAAGTIPYELLCGVTGRVPRVFE